VCLAAQARLSGKGAGFRPGAAIATRGKHAVHVLTDQPEHDPIRARALEVPDLLCRPPLFFRPERSEVERIRVTPDFYRDHLDALHAVREFIDAPNHREPSIAPLRHTPEGAGVVDAAEEDRRMWLALGLREAPHRREVDVTAMISEMSSVQSTFIATT
jgi:hypothetical protein